MYFSKYNLEMNLNIYQQNKRNVSRTIKKEDYAAHGIVEYWIIDPNKQTVEQYLLMQPNDKVYFEPYIYNIGEDITSKVIEGFTIPIAAIFDEAANVKALQNFMQNDGK